MPDPVGLPLRKVADLTGRPISDVYVLFRLETAPPPIAHVASVPVYDPREALRHVLGSDRAADVVLERLRAKIEACNAALRRDEPV